MIYRRRNRDR